MDAAEYKHIVLGVIFLNPVWAKLRLLVKTIQKKWKYPPDGQDKATETVLEQPEAFSAAWATV